MRAGPGPAVAERRPEFWGPASGGPRCRWCPAVRGVPVDARKAGGCRSWRHPGGGRGSGRSFSARWSAERRRSERFRNFRRWRLMRAWSGCPRGYSRVRSSVSPISSCNWDVRRNPGAFPLGVSRSGIREGAPQGGAPSGVPVRDLHGHDGAAAGGGGGLSPLSFPLAPRGRTRSPGASSNPAGGGGDGRGGEIITHFRPPGHLEFPLTGPLWRR